MGPFGAPPSPFFIISARVGIVTSRYRPAEALIHSTMGLSEAEVAEIKAFQQSKMAESKKIWATRVKEAQAAVADKRAANGTWRQMSGMALMSHEISHIGNRPFMIGFAVSALGALWIQTKFTDEMRKSSLYWSTYHGGK